MPKRTPGLYRRGEIWHFDKWVGGIRVRGSSETSDLALAEEKLRRRIEAAKRSRAASGLIFRDAATQYLTEYDHKRSIARDAQALELADLWIGDLPLDEVSMETLKPMIEARLKGLAPPAESPRPEKWARRTEWPAVSPGTINRDLAVVRRVLTLSARKWRTGNQAWLATAPLIEMLPEPDKRAAYALSYQEQALLFGILPRHLADAALFKVNTGCREAEVAGLRWSWEYSVPELGVSVLVVSADIAKNGRERIVVLNSVAAAVIEAQRGRHPEFVFTYPRRRRRNGATTTTLEPFDRLYNSGWKRARRDAAKAYPDRFRIPVPWGFRNVRVHDLKHTFGKRLRAAGVSFEDRQDLLGHKSQRITTHYSAPEIASLLEAAEKVVQARVGATLVRVNTA